METAVGALNMEQTMTLLKQWNLHKLMGDTYVYATYLCYSAHYCRFDLTVDILVDFRDHMEIIPMMFLLLLLFF